MKIEKFWNTCRGNLAHIRDNWEMNSDSKRAREFHNEFLDKYDWNDKTVVEYGCGGGYIGLYLFEYLNIRKYIGIDISDRSLQKASEVLFYYDHELYNHNVDFNFSADFFISIACIQHFHNKDYLIHFLNKLNKSEIGVLILQIRSGDLKFNENEIDFNSMPFCYCNSVFISKHLTKYDLVYAGEVNKKSKGQYLIYER